MSALGLSRKIEGGDYYHAIDMCITSIAIALSNYNDDYSLDKIISKLNIEIVGIDFIKCFVNISISQEDFEKKVTENEGIVYKKMKSGVIRAIGEYHERWLEFCRDEKRENKIKELTERFIKEGKLVCKDIYELS